METRGTLEVPQLTSVHVFECWGSGFRLGSCLPQAQTKVEVILTRRFRIVVLSVVYMFYRYTGAHAKPTLLVKLLVQEELLAFLQEEGRAR